MLGRLFVGLVTGAIVGAMMAAILIRGFELPMFSSLFAYAAAAVTGAGVGLVAGKPIWAKGGKIEAGLKGLFGALLAAAGMFALRKWGSYSVDLRALGAGVGTLGELPGAALPILGAALGAFYAADNTPDAAAGASHKRAKSGTRIVADAGNSTEEDGFLEPESTRRKADK